jgi:energy-coupling factor transport system ATP-binding protein
MNIAIRDLAFQYPGGVQALDGVSLSIEPGESVALIGENGAGKSTLAKHLNGLLKPASGEVRIGDWDTREHSPAQLARRVGYAFQNPDNQIFASRVAEEVAFGPRNLGFNPAEVEETVEAALYALGLSTERETHPYDLHIADRKLLTIASVLAMRTPIVILDEPTTGQDAAHIAEVGAVVESLKMSGHTVIAISHDLDFCARHFERVIVMRDGLILIDGRAAEVLTQPALLARAAVEPPQLVRLALALNLPGFPRDPAEFINLLSR